MVLFVCLKAEQSSYVVLNYMKLWYNVDIIVAWIVFFSEEITSLFVEAE